MCNGIWPKPTNKRFNLAYHQIKYLIFRNIHSNTFWLDKTFIFSSQVTMMFQKKRFSKNKKIRVRFSIMDFPTKPDKQKKQVALKKLLRLHTRRAAAAAAERVNQFLKKIIFFQNSWSGPQTYLGADRRQKSKCLWQSVFCELSFWFWPGSPKMPLNV